VLVLAAAAVGESDFDSRPADIVLFLLILVF
jgi:hypothetical protein